jgi:hypothetical protein
MNSRLFITLISLGTAPWIAAQSSMDPDKAGSFMNIIEELQVAGTGKPNEVTVVLPPPDEAPVAAEEPPSKEVPSNEASPPAEDAGKDELQPAEDSEKPEEPTEVSSPADAEVPPAEDNAPKDPKPGLAVRVERLQAGSAEIDPAKVKLLAPFPAKLLARSPEGWVIESSESAPPFTREVELSPGKRITLNVRPHLLVAQADGSNVFQIAEPGFDAGLGYRQNATVAAILSTSIRQLEDDSRQLGTVIDQLQQLLVSLPQPSNTPDPAPETKPKTNRKR